MERERKKSDHPPYKTGHYVAVKTTPWGQEGYLRRVIPTSSGVPYTTAALPQLDTQTAGKTRHTWPPCIQRVSGVSHSHGRGGADGREEHNLPACPACPAFPLTNPPSSSALFPARLAHLRFTPRFHTPTHPPTHVHTHTLWILYIYTRVSTLPH